MALSNYFQPSAWVEAADFKSGFQVPLFQPNTDNTLLSHHGSRHCQ